jgi:hypothetical protein
MWILASKGAVGRLAVVVGPAMALLSTAALLSTVVLLSGCLGTAQSSSSDTGPNGTCADSGCYTVMAGDGGPGSNCSANANNGQGGNGGDWDGKGGQGSNGGGNGGQGSYSSSGTDVRGGDGAPGC